MKTCLQQVAENGLPLTPSTVMLAPHSLGREAELDAGIGISLVTALVAGHGQPLQSWSNQVIIEARSLSAAAPHGGSVTGLGAGVWLNHGARLLLSRHLQQSLVGGVNGFFFGGSSNSGWLMWDAGSGRRLKSNSRSAIGLSSFRQSAIVMALQSWKGVFSPFKVVSIFAVAEGAG